MDQIAVLQAVICELNDLKWPYFLVGSFAVSYYGKPRATHDIDIKIAIPPEGVRTVEERFSGKFYVSPEGIRDALRHGTMFNLIHNETNTKVDFWILLDEAFDRERLKRRKVVPLFGLPTAITTAEDLVVIKLKWYRESESDKHLYDARGVLEIQEDKLDLEYIQKWITCFHLEKEWEKALKF